MVAYSKILAHNEALKSLSSPVAIFIGATQGIGLGALKAFAKHTTNPTVYFVGRSPKTLDTITADLKTLNPGGTYVPVECADLTRLRSVDAACASITNNPNQAPKKVDILCLSAGFMSFSGRLETSEGIDAQMSIQYYSRMKFVQNLLPLVRKSTAPRILSVLSGGKEGQLWPDDFPLKYHYSIGNTAGACGSMNTLYMEELAKKNENNDVSFVHILPGFVGDTNIFNKPEHFGPVMRFVLGRIVTPIVSLFIGISSEEVGERVLYAATSKSFNRAGADDAELAVGSDSKKGSGVYLVQSDSSVVAGPAILSKMREEGMGVKVSDHTQQEFDRISKLCFHQNSAFADA